MFRLLHAPAHKEVQAWFWGAIRYVPSVLLNDDLLECPSNSTELAADAVISVSMIFFLQRGKSTITRQASHPLLSRRF
jgi:hypothetical protein